MRPIQVQRARQFREHLYFAHAWLRNPRQVGAVAPSSAFLADMITKSVEPSCAPVIELGPGTGVFTRALIARGVREEDIYLVECNPKFANTLRREFPRSRILCEDASKLRAVEFFGRELAGAVISGLPLLAMPVQKVSTILCAVFRQMSEDASLFQFTYGLHCPVHRSVMNRLGLRSERIGSTYANLPPATVYRIWRQLPYHKGSPSRPWRICSAQGKWDGGRQEQLTALTKREDYLEAGAGGCDGQSV